MVVCPDISVDHGAWCMLHAGCTEYTDTGISKHTVCAQVTACTQYVYTGHRLHTAYVHSLQHEQQWVYMHAWITTEPNTSKAAWQFKLYCAFCIWYTTFTSAYIASLSTSTKQYWVLLSSSLEHDCAFFLYRAAFEKPQENCVDDMRRVVPNVLYCLTAASG